MQLEQYLDRIGISAGALDWLSVNADALSLLQRAHLASIPFENLDIVQGKTPLALDEDALFEKMVRQRHGGICYEQNLLFAAALRAFGFNVELKGGRHPKYGDDMDHLFLLVTIPDDSPDRQHAKGATSTQTPWLADVGFAANFATPLRLVIEETQDDGFDRYLISTAPEAGKDYLRLSRIPGLEGDTEANEMFTFGPQTCVPSDCRERCDWFSTAPESRFTQGPLVTMQCVEGRRTLSGNHYIETSGDMRRSIDVASSEQFNQLLREKFDLHPLCENEPREARTYDANNSTTSNTTLGAEPATTESASESVLPPRTEERRPNMSEKPTRVLFVCHGNICRSSMAQCVLQHLVDQAGLTSRFTIDSAATTNEEIGNPIYPPAREKLDAEGVPIVPHRARRIMAGEQNGWDYIVCMDDENIRHLRRILGPENMGKVRKLMSYVGEDREVADPWYTRDFDATYNDVLAGCTALLKEIG